MQCPGCDRTLRLGAKSCSCGWAAADKPRSAPAPLADADRGRCAWTSGVTRCRFPGSMSHGLRGELPFFCPWHFRGPDQQAGAEIVRQSLEWDGKPESYLAMRRASMKPTPRQEEPGSLG